MFIYQFIVIAAEITLHTILTAVGPDHRFFFFMFTSHCFDPNGINLRIPQVIEFVSGPALISPNKTLPFSTWIA